MAPWRDVITLREAIAAQDPASDAALLGKQASIAFAELSGGSTLAHAQSALRGRSVLIHAASQLAAATALIELDGVARRIVLCTPDLTPAQLAGVAETAGAEAVVTDNPDPVLPSLPHHLISPRPAPRAASRESVLETEWILMTSGTTGTPKLVRHSLHSLAGALATVPAVEGRRVWSTFYDMRRYGGLQIFLRAVRGGASMLLSDAGEPAQEFLARAARAGVTHLSGTPSHWRRALMSGAAHLIDPAYVRLSGEIADQALLDRLRCAYPRASIGHAFASTEAGVAFDVNDGLAGFPAEYLDGPRDGIELRVVDGTLRVRSRRNAAGYLNSSEGVIRDADGFVDTGDLVELENGRCHFRGRRGGVINVGGLKVHPE
ncbi:MAG: AMP-binding protein, partial [Gammaproteobacteria bacterium]|nr:AMP-binding protein [Gammaproteobacteria bacterium]